MTEVRNSLLHGTLDALILETLSHGPRHGYGIAVRIEDQTGDSLLVEEGSLQRFDSPIWKVPVAREVAEEPGFHVEMRTRDADRPGPRSRRRPPGCACALRRRAPGRAPVPGHRRREGSDDATA